MFHRRLFQRAWFYAMLGACALTIVGCAGLPRIDPTGERIFIWPRDQVPAVAPAQGNPQAPPVFTDPVFPPPAMPSASGQTAVPAPPVPQDTLSITPQRVLAPVGSEVILKAGLCTREKFLLTDSRIEWLIARDSAGEFVSLGGRGWIRNPLLPWNKPKKIDNQYATGYTAKMPLTITRGTADVTDDVQIEPGEAWASITSPVEGVSRITAVAPEIVAWSQRRATATIYWVDVQWTFPPATVTADGSHVLTTSVRRQTDGTPLQGWLVRYEVADGAGALKGGQSNQVVEVTTDAKGQASIDVTPTGAAGNTTRITTQLVRPDGYRGSDAPRLIVANGTTTINWSGAGTPYLPPPDDLGGSIPVGPIPPTQPVQPTTPPTTLRPSLEIEIYGDSETQVGGQARFEVVIRNKGNGEATGIVLNDRFDEGLSHLRDPDRNLEVENAGIGTLAPGSSRTVILNFEVLRAGKLCHIASVRSNEGAEAQKQACINALQPVPQKQASMKVEKSGPHQRIVGEIAPFTLVVTNTGEVPLSSVEIIDEYPPSLRASPTQQGYEKISQGDNRDRFIWRIPRLEVGATTRIDVQCQCIAQASKACSTVRVNASTGTAVGAIAGADEHCMRILPARDVVPGSQAPAAGGVSPVTPNTPGTIQLGITSFADPVRVGQRATYQIIIQNGPTFDKQVQLRLLFPAELTPDVAAIRNDANVRATVVGNELRFEPIEEIRPNERLEFLIPVNVNQPGIRNIVAELTSRNSPTPIQQIKSVEIIR